MSNTPDVTVWEADGEPWETGRYGCDIRARLVLAGFRVTRVDLAERLPNDRELEAPMHVVTGGNSPATMGTGWVPAARDCLNELLGATGTGEHSVVGICFGAQLLAVALAGPRAIRPTFLGMEAGLRNVAATDGGRGFVVTQFHHHEVRPEALDDAGAELSFTNAHTQVQGFRVGRRIAGYQFHPELDPQTAIAVFRHNRRTIRATGGCAREAIRSARERQREWYPDTFDRLVTDHLVSSHDHKLSAVPDSGGI